MNTMTEPTRAEFAEWIEHPVTRSRIGKLTKAFNERHSQLFQVANSGGPAERLHTLGGQAGGLHDAYTLLTAKPPAEGDNEQS